MSVSPANYKMQTMSAYDVLAAELVTGFDGFFERFAHREAAHLLASLTQDGLILDLGCGGGPASRYLANVAMRRSAQT